MSGNPEKIPVSSDVRPLCDELVELAILPRLPVKALMRLKCVSRQWDGFISRPSPRFIYLQSLHAATYLLDNRVAVSICLSSDPRSVGNPSIHERIRPRMEYLWDVRIIASCNGLLCCSDGDPGRNIAIGNPYMNNWKLIPLKMPSSWEDKDWEQDPLKIIYYEGNGDRYAFGLAVDVESSVRYTLLLLIIHNNNKSDIFVFSSTTEQWSTIRGQSVFTLGDYLDKKQAAVYVEGCLYWMVQKDLNNPRYWDHKTDCGVFWFNIGNNLYGFHPLPDGSDYPMHGELGEYGGKISYAVIKTEDIHVWSLDHQGWSKKFSITIDILANTYNQRIICFEGGGLLTFCIDGTVYSLDTLAGTLNKLADGYIWNNWVSYKNTLVPLPLERQQNAGRSTV